MGQAKQRGTVEQRREQAIAARSQVIEGNRTGKSDYTRVATIMAFAAALWPSDTGSRTRLHR